VTFRECELWHSSVSQFCAVTHTVTARKVVVLFLLHHSAMDYYGALWHLYIGALEIFLFSLLSCYSAKRGLAIACRPSVRVSVGRSVCSVGGLWSHKFEILETNCTDNWPNTFALCSPKDVYLFLRNMAQFWGDCRSDGEIVACWNTKSARQSKKYYGWSTGNYQRSSNGTIFDPLRPPFLRGWGLQPPPKTPI